MNKSLSESSKKVQKNMDDLIMQISKLSNHMKETADIFEKISQDYKDSN